MRLIESHASAWTHCVAKASFLSHLVLMAVVSSLGIVSPPIGKAIVTAAASENTTISNETATFSVLSLFHPTKFRLQPMPGSTLAVELDGHLVTLPQNGWIEIRSLAEERLEVRCSNASAIEEGARLRVSSASPGGVPSFLLAVPGKLERQYTGSLAIQGQHQALEALVTTPIELAVASIVQAESPAGAGLEALKAQAIAARSFLVARQTPHVGFDFCDTTHCQFLGPPAAPGGLAERAAQTTRSIVLAYQDQQTMRQKTLAAMYARSCSGETRTLHDIGASSGAYPYYRVRCTYCTHHPESWRRSIVAGDLLQAGDYAETTERQRLAFNRIHGWSALPSLPAPIASGEVLETINGKGIGHGLGLCQLGAADMARHGADYRQILAWYYPNTRLTVSAPR